MTAFIFQFLRRAALVAGAAAFLTNAPFASAQAIDATRRWEFNAPREVLSFYNIQDAQIKEGMLIGKTKFDPYFSLALPAAGLDAARYFKMRVRMFSSTPADAIGIYYKDEGDDWALGAGPKIRAGWHEYDFDLNTNVGWKVGDAGRDEARLWGGPNKVVKRLRIDPGNQADRDLKIDWIEIVADPKVSGAPPATVRCEANEAVETTLPPQATWNWKIGGDLAGWVGGNFVNLEARGGVLCGLTKYDPSLLAPQPLQFDAREYAIAEFKIKSDIGGSGEIYFTRSGETYSDQRVLHTSLVGDNQWHVYRVNMAGSPSWSGIIEGLRFDPLNAAGANFQIEYLRLLPPEDGNMIANGDFELADPVGTQHAENWIVSQGRAELMPRPGSGNALLLSGDAAGEATLWTGDFENLTVGAHQFALEYQSDSSATIQLSAAFQSIYGEKLAPVHFTIPLAASTNWRRAEQIIGIPERAAQMSIALQVKGIRKVYLDKVVLTSLTAPAEAAEPTPDGQLHWQASWIAAPDAVGKNAALRYFRTSFHIDDPTTVENARVLVTADSAALLWINGTQLPGGPFCETWSIADVYDIAPFLIQGENVIGVQSWNQGGSEGVMAEVGIHTRGSQTQFFFTDAVWKAKAGEVPANWASAEFSAADWHAAQLIASFPGGPWGAAVDYLYLGPWLPLREVQFSFADSAEMGETQPLSVAFTPEQIPTHPVFVTLELAKPGHRNVSLWSQQLDTSKWQAGAPVKIGPVPVPLPRYAAPGNYQLRLQVPYAKLSPAASLQPIVGEQGSHSAAGDTIAKNFKLNLTDTIRTPVVKIKYLHDGQVPALEINGQTHTVMHMMHGNAEKKLIRLTRENAVDLIWLNIEHGFGWNKGGPYDFSKLDRLCADLLNQYPDAYLVLNVPLDPVYNAGMRSWNAQHPDELVKDHAGKTRIGGYAGATIEAPSYSSPVWMKDASDAWRALIAHVRSSSIGERVIGYVPISGISWEWFYWGAQSGDFADYSAPAREHFQRWAREKYGDIGNVNRRWKTAYSNFDAIEIPTKEERLATDAWMFLDPQKSQRVIDFHEFFSDVVCGDVLEFCRVVKEETQGDSLAGTYYGYNMQVISSYLAHNTGHMALHKAMQSPDIDFLMSPSRYDDRGIGGGSGFMMTVDSTKLHGKFYIDQADIRTVNASGAGGQLARLSTLQESLATLQREFANSVTSGVASQWYDFGLGWIGGDARLMEAIGKMQKIEADLLKIPRRTMDADRNIAVIGDEKSTFYTGTASDIHSAIVSAQISSLNRTGVGFDTYVLDDLEQLGGYKAFLFLNTFRITPAQQKFIDEKLKRGGKVLTWVFAPGVIDENTLDFSRAASITGFKMGVINEAAPLRVTVAASENALMRYVATDSSYGNPQKAGPILYARDGQSLGVTEGTEMSGLAIKEFADWTSIFSRAPNLPPKLLREMAVMAGLPVYNFFDGDVTYVGDRLFAVHTYGGGPRTFTVPAKDGQVKELLRGETAMLENGSFSFNLPAKSTSLFLLPPAQ